MIKFRDLLEKSGAGDWGTDELRKTLEKGTPGQGITDMGVKNKERKESVELPESEYKVIKVVGDDYKKMKKGRSYGTFPATDKGRDQATAFQLKLKRQKGVEADLVWESLDELDEITFHQGIGSGGDEVMKQLLKSLKKSGKRPDLQKSLERQLKKTDKKEEVELDELSPVTKMKAAIARGIRGPSKKATPTWARETGKAAKELKKRAAQKAEYEKKKRAMQKRGALTSFKEGNSFKDVAEKACWKGYKQVGMKKKNGKEVPNCVPEEKE